jgi:adsorption protein B
MAGYEQRHGIELEIVVIHDAEDLVHPQALQLISRFWREHQMVQVPVLPLATGLGEWTHGVYCDEFAEFQLKDIPVHQALGGFLPSNGVGTGFDRSAWRACGRRTAAIFSILIA